MNRSAPSPLGWRGATYPPRRWRSLLFVPADVRRFWRSASAAGSDAVVIDLEDGVGDDRKAAARALAIQAVGAMRGHGFDLLVRVNSGQQEMERDLCALVGPRISAVVLPKVSGTEQIAAASSLLGELEEEHGLPPRSVGIVLLIETAAGLGRVAELARADPRICAIAGGDEDLAANLGVEPDSPILTFAKHMTVVAAAAAGVQPLGLCGSIAEYADLDQVRTAAIEARRIGLTGSFCIHPRQVRVLIEAFTPSPEELEHARRVTAAYGQALAAGHTVASLDGRMVDRPVAARAAGVLSLGARADPPPDQHGGEDG